MTKITNLIRKLRVYRQLLRTQHRRYVPLKAQISAHHPDTKLRRLEQLISPLAQRLEIEVVSGNVAFSPVNSIWPVDSQFLIDTGGADDNTSGDSDFSRDSGKRAGAELATQADPIPRRNVKLAEQTAFEYLSQHILRQRARSFVNLSPRQQALAKVGNLLHTHEESYTQRTHYFWNNNLLVAVLDRERSRFYMQVDPPAVDYSELSHSAHHEAASVDNAEFEVLPLLDALWMYGQFDPESLLDLPSDMGVKRLQLHRMPAISPRLMTVRHMQLIRRLLMRPMRFEILRRQTPKDQQPALLGDLATLFVTRSLVILNDSS